MQSKALGQPGHQFRLSLLESLPGESLFSLCARHHRFWGFATATSTCLALFGAPRKGVHHDLPNSLGGFAEQTLGAYGTASKLAKNRTLLSFYSPFLAPEAFEAAADLMSGSSVAHLKFRLGLLTSRFRAHHPLKACDECMASDACHFGWTYWHLEHQYPGVWSCTRHGRPLRESGLKANGVERFQWHLPCSDDLSTQDIPSLSAQDARHKLSCLIVQLVQAQRLPGWLSMEATRLAIRSRLGERRWISVKGNLRASKASDSFQEYLQHLAELPDLTHTQWDDDNVKNWVAKLVRPPRSGTHPLRWLMIIDWLFESANDFIEAYDNASVAAAELQLLQPAPSSSIETGRVGRSAKSAVVERLRAGASARQVSAEFGISVGTAMAWGAGAGIEPARRPKTFRPETRAAVVLALKAGDSKAEISKSFGVSVQTVTRLLRTEPGLRSAWQTAVTRIRQVEHRDIWTRLLASHPGLGRKMHRSMRPATYAWLYRHDRGWLDAHFQVLTVHEPRRSPVQWDERDRALAESVHATVRRMVDQGRSSRIKLGEIVQALPALRAKLGSLHRLPLTKQALAAAKVQVPRHSRLNMLDE